MPDVVQCKVTGLKELQEALEQKPRNIAKKILRKVMRAAAALWREEMQRLAPKLQDVKLSTNPKQVRVPGDLSRHIGMKVSIRGDELEGSVAVGPVRRVFWGLFNEFGTSKMKAQPFIRPAFEAKKQDVLDKFIKEAAEVVLEETRQ